MKISSGVFRMCTGGLGDLGDEAGAFFVNECLNFDVLGKKINKTAKKPSPKVWVD